MRDDTTGDGSRNRAVARYAYASINVKPERGGPWADVRHLTSIAFPILGNLTKNLGPRVGTFAFFVRRNGTKSHSPGAAKVLKDGCFQ